MVQADDLADFLYVLQRKCLLDRATALNGYSLYPTKVDLRPRAASRSGRARGLVVDRHCWRRGRRSPDVRAPVSPWFGFAADRTRSWIRCVAFQVGNFVAGLVSR